jgi:hypothetical protein
VSVGDGGGLTKTVGIYPKHDIYIGFGEGMTTIVEIHDNRFLMHRQSGTDNPFKPYGRAIRLVGFRGDPAVLPDDPGPGQGKWEVRIGGNAFGGGPE